MAARVLSPGEVLPRPINDSAPEWQENFNLKLICPDCREDPPDLREEFSAGDTVCGSCGLVLANRIVDTRSEWRTFANDDGKDVDPSRVGDGANPLLNGDQLNTRIAMGGNTASRDLQRAQSKASGEKASKGLLAAYEAIGQFCDAHQYERNVSESAKHIYKTIFDEGAFKGKNTEALVASCIFIACRQNNVSRSFKEITELTRVPKKEIGRTFKAVEQFLKDHYKKQQYITTGGVTLSNANYRNTESSKAADLCRRYCSHLGLSTQVSAVTQKIADVVQEKGALAGRSPLSIAAVCIYMASFAMGHPKGPKEIGQVCNVSDGTIRSAYKTFYPQREELIDADWLASRGGDIKNLPQA